jgi:hypothetical protein
VHEDDHSADHRRPSGSSRNSHTGSEQSRQTVPKNLIARLSQAGSSTAVGFRRPALACTVSVVQAIVMHNTTKQRGRRERSPAQEYLIVNAHSRKEEGDLRGRRLDLDPGHRLDMVRWTETLAGKEGISPFKNIPRIIPINGKRCYRLATHHVHPSIRSSHPRPRPRWGAHVWLASLLFNFTSAIHFVNLLSRVKASSNTFTILFTFILRSIKVVSCDSLLPPSQNKCSSHISRSQQVVTLTGYMENNINICVCKQVRYDNMWHD